jgi:flagellar hook-basal body complex protein FliE
MAIDAIAAKVITGVGTSASPAAPAAGSADRGASFGDALTRLVGAVEQSHAGANGAVNGMLSGQVDVHDAMIALQRADMTLQFGVQVRNKLVNAYQDIMRMPV